LLGGLAAFYARYPQLCAGNGRLDTTTTVTGVGDDVIAGAPDDSEEIVTPSDSALLGHINDQVMTDVSPCYEQWR